MYLHENHTHVMGEFVWEINHNLDSGQQRDSVMYDVRFLGRNHNIVVLFEINVIYMYACTCMRLCIMGW